MYYRFKNENELLDWADYQYKDDCQFTDIITGEEYSEHPNKVIISDCEISVNPNYEQEEKEKEEQIKMQMFLTGADVERAIYKNQGIDFEDVLKLLEEKYSQVVDIKAVRIELKANNFYRGNPYVIQIGKILGYSDDDLDYLFEHKVLPTKDEEQEQETEDNNE